MRRVIKVLNGAEGVVLILVLVLLIGLTLAGVVLRYVFNNPFTWMEEVQLMCLVWISFLGASMAFRYRGHVAIEVVVDILPVAAQKVARFVIAAVVYLVLVYLFLRCLDFLAVFAATGRTTPVLRIPFTLVYGIAPVSIVLMLISFTIAEFGRSQPGPAREEAEVAL